MSLPRKRGVLHSASTLPALDIILVLFILLATVVPFMASSSNSTQSSTHTWASFQPHHEQINILLDELGDVFFYEARAWQKLSGQKALLSTIAALLEDHQEEVVLHIVEQTPKATLLNTMNALEAMNVVSIGVVKVTTRGGGMKTIKPLIASFWLHGVLLLFVFNASSSYSTFIAISSQSSQLISKPMLVSNLDVDQSLPKPGSLVTNSSTRLTFKGHDAHDSFSHWREQLYALWRYPEGLSLDRPAVFLLRLNTQGDILSVALTQSSGNKQWDGLMRQNIAQTSLQALAQLKENTHLLSVELKPMEIGLIQWVG